ncbi:TonB-dependent receptor [Phenylobacterium montanum]|uniref:TonB-dependent receptor n=1 Tax=Phenylobacterium montanum TaxID=2823693 RepID=A0A975G4C9_9CAUL|nr:TonB-dependent receptor [Caulobacter sp. S6]QUD89801.1 TonB-dependent receptor [Caulobacter sp. S6]
MTQRRQSAGRTIVRALLRPQLQLNTAEQGQDRRDRAGAEARAARGLARQSKRGDLMKTRLSNTASIAVLALAAFGAALPAAAQQAAGATATNAAPEQVGEVVVTGLRSSLQNAMKIKENASGVVDAISADDIGKFPDTNLAESIQRIPGVTINRNNGEGARITVRGFGPEYNLVTLNGRVMPGTADPPLGSGLGVTRSFDFENLSADSISGVEVYKTGRADIQSGGIGSTVDIRTARPFDYHSLQATLQVKGTDDTSSPKDSLKPEVSGLLSDTFFDGKLGLLVSGSYSERQSQLQDVNINGWQQDLLTNTTPGVTSSNTNPAGHIWSPQGENWFYADANRVRENGQVVLQYRPIDSMTFTIDDTYALLRESTEQHQVGAWFSMPNDLRTATVNREGTVTNMVAAGNDLAFESAYQHYRASTNEIGVNAKWDATDNVTLTFDADDAIATSGDPGSEGDGGFNIMGFNSAPNGNPIFATKTFCLCNLQIPTVTYAFNNVLSPAAGGNGGISGFNQLSAANASELFGQDNGTIFRSEVQQWGGNLVWRNRSDSALESIRFGGGETISTTRNRSFNSGNLYPYYYGTIGNASGIPYTVVPTSGLFQGFSGGGSANPIPYIYSYNMNQAVQYLGSSSFVLPATPTNDDHITEDTWNAYVQMNLATEFNGMPFKALVGTRFEHTETTAKSLVQVPTAITQTSASEYQTVFGGGTSFSNIRKSYDEFLPSLDMSLGVRPNLILRASFSKTITRSDLTALVGTETFNNSPKPGARSISAGNPALLPYESYNTDLSAEWYYGKNSYVSVNYFSKYVNNFLITKTSQVTYPNLTDPSAGPRYTNAQNELIASGIANPSSQQIFARMQTDAGTSVLTGLPTDPAIVWDLTEPSNAQTTEIHGWEFAIQHVFGDSGFGGQVNVSLPYGGPHFDPKVTGNQFVLPGLSKSVNVVAFYEKYGFTGRLAYNYRSSYLAGWGQSSSPDEPIFVEARSQLDASAAYSPTKNWSVFMDAINITNEGQRTYGRYKDQFMGAQVLKARYQFGLKYKF